MDFFGQIKEKINKKINPENIILIDNSSFHSKHKSFDPNKLHLKIIIKSEKLKSMNKIPRIPNPTGYTQSTVKSIILLSVKN